MQKENKANSCYLAQLVTVVTITSASFGISLVSTDELGDFYNFKNDYKDEETVMQWLTVSSAIGLMIGSISSGTFVSIGRRRSILISSSI